MQQPTTVSRIGAWLVLFARGTAWIGVLAYFAVFAGASYAISAMVANPAATLQTGGRFAFVGASVVQFILWALIALYLARKLGGGPARTAWGTWLLALAAYYLVGLVPPGLMQAVIVAQFQDDPQMVSPAATGFGFFWNAVVFPLLVWLAAAGHGGKAVGLRTTWTYLTERAPGLWGLYMAVLLASLLLSLAVNLPLGGQMATVGTLLLQGSINAIRTAATVLFSIMAYREIREAQSPPDRAFA